MTRCDGFGLAKIPDGSTEINFPLIMIVIKDCVVCAVAESTALESLPI